MPTFGKERKMDLKGIDIKATREAVKNEFGIFRMLTKKELVDYISYTSSVISIPEKGSTMKSLEKKYLEILAMLGEREKKVQKLVKNILALDEPFKSILIKILVYGQQSKSVELEYSYSHGTFHNKENEAYVRIAFRLDLIVYEGEKRK